VGKDRDKAKEMIKKSGQMGVPVIDIGGEIIVGFDQAKLDSLLPKKA
jgi:glutaredoxin 3